MEKKVAAQVSADRAVDFSPIRIIAEMNLAQSALLVGADLHHRGRLLLVVDTEAGEEARQALEAKSSCLRAKNKVPIEGVVEGLVERPHLLPDPTSPEHGLLRDIVRPYESLPGVRRQHPAADFQSVFVDENPMTVNDIEAGFGQEGPRHIGERTRQ